MDKVIIIELSCNCTHVCSVMYCTCVDVYAVCGKEDSTTLIKEIDCTICVHVRYELMKATHHMYQ